MTCCQYPGDASLAVPLILNGNLRDPRSRPQTAPHPSLLTAPRRSAPAPRRGLVVGDVRRPTVRGSHSGVKGFVCIGEPLRPGILNQLQRTTSTVPGTTRPNRMSARSPVLGAQPSVRVRRLGADGGDRSTDLRLRDRQCRLVNAMSELGRLERMDLRKVWETEAQDFTPWLATEENLSVQSSSP